MQVFHEQGSWPIKAWVDGVTLDDNSLLCRIRRLAAIAPCECGKPSEIPDYVITQCSRCGCLELIDELARAAKLSVSNPVMHCPNCGATDGAGCGACPNASAAELTQVTAQSVERASPAKDDAPFMGCASTTIADLAASPQVQKDLRNFQRIFGQPLASQMRPQSAVQGWQPIETAPKDLHFDPENPRFMDLGSAEEEEIILELYEQSDVDELIQSILSAGYIDFEPLIVLQDSNIVLEGNRRLAALRLIADETLRKKLKVTLPAIENPKKLPETVRVLLVKSRDDARSFIGFKHINGPFKWDALAKAKYAAQWHEKGGDIGTISRTLGDNHNTVRRLVNGWFALQQAKKDGFDMSQISRKNFAFSHLYTALTRASVREFLGMKADDLSAPPQIDPVPAEKRNEFQQLMFWLYGQQQRGEQTIIQSQNPNLNELSKVLGNPEARAMLLARRDLRSAYERVEPAATRFEEALITAAKQCEDVLGLAGAYQGEPTLLKVAEGMQRTTRALVTTMREKHDTPDA